MPDFAQGGMGLIAVADARGEFPGKAIAQDGIAHTGDDGAHDEGCRDEKPHPDDSDLHAEGQRILALLRAYREQQLSARGLSEREVAVALEIASGKTFGEVARTLFISERTVKFHSRNIYDKLGVKGKKEFMRLVESL